MSATQATKQVELENTNRWSTRQLVTMALMCAIAALFSFIQIPLLPAAPFLTYDPSLMPAMVCGFAFGPGAGFVVGSIAAVIHGLILGEWVGSLMNICATLFFVVPSALIYKKKHTLKGAILGLIVGVVCATAGAIVANLTDRRSVLVRQRRCHHAASPSCRRALQPDQDRAELASDAHRVQGDLKSHHAEEKPGEGPLNHDWEASARRLRPTGRRVPHHPRKRRLVHLRRRGVRALGRKRARSSAASSCASSAATDRGSRRSRSI